MTRTHLRIALPFAMLMFHGVLCAQFSGAIQGTVQDSTGAAIPQATVKATNIATGVVREVVTADDGVYRVLSLGPGTYRIQIERQGFRNADRDGIELGTNAVVRVDFALQLGAMTESVTVTAATAMVETEQGRITANVDAVQLREMPLKGRNIYNIIAIQPGVTGRGLGGGAITGSNDTFAGETQPDLSASGQRSESNNFTVDDTSVNSVARGGVANITPNPDSVEEVRVVANNFSAVDGRNAGAQIQVITKSGKNQLFGSLSYYFANNTLSARNFNEAVVPVFRKNQFNYAVGGPIKRNRTFFFHSYEGMRQSGGRGVQATVETAAFRDLILQTRPNSIAAKLLRTYAPAGYPTTGLRDLGSPKAGINVSGPADGIMDVGNIIYVPDTYRNAGQRSLRIDHELIPGKGRLYGTYYFTQVESLTGGARPAFDRSTMERTQFGNINYTHILSPTMINEFRGGVSRLLGLPEERGADLIAVPNISVPLAPAFGPGNVPWGWAHTNYNYKDILSWVHRSHIIKFGVELRDMIGNQMTDTAYIPN